LGHLDYAIASERQALALDPTHTGALSALEDFYRKGGRWSDLASVLTRHGELETDPDKRVDLYLSLADLWENQLGDIEQAIAAYRQSIEVNPACLDALGALERMYRRLARWEPLVEVLTKKTQAIEDAEQVIRLKQQIGELWQDRIGDAEQA